MRSIVETLPVAGLILVPIFFGGEDSGIRVLVYG